MKVGESQELLAQFDRDVSAENDPGLRAWYEHEFMLQSDYLIAMQARQALGTLATQLTRLYELKSVVSAEVEPETRIIEIAVEDEDVVEKPRILTPEEMLHRRIERKYESCLKRYDADIEEMTSESLNKGKREHRQRQAVREFAQRFTDFSGVTGDEHMVLRADTIDWTASNVIEDDELLKGVLANCANYAERHGAAVTSNPQNFAAIIAGSVAGKPNAKNFETILKGIFSTRHNTSDFPQINVNLAAASFELLEDDDALYKTISLGCLREPYISTTYAVEINKAVELALIRGDTEKVIELMQAPQIFGMLNFDITGLNYPANHKIAYAMGELKSERVENILIVSRDLSEDQVHQRDDLITRLESRASMTFDPVSVKSFTDGEVLDIGTKPQESDISDLMELSNLYHKRMQHLAPYSYAFRAAKKLLGDNVYGRHYAYSPSTTIDVYFGTDGSGSGRPLKISDKDFRMMLAMAAHSRQLGVSSYEQSRQLTMVYRPLSESEQDGVIIVRPNIPLDKARSPAIQLLMLNYATTVGQIRDEGEPAISVAEYEQANEAMRQEIKAAQKRFLGRRPIKFVMLDDLRRGGLEAISMRYDEKADTVRTRVNLADGDVDLTLDSDFHIDIPDRYESLNYDNLKAYYENIILKHVSIWMCHQEVRTSEGVVSERTRNAANMGHFGYLRIKEGTKWKHSKTQAGIYAKEQRYRRTTLQQESERLAVRPDAIDEATGIARNSTYYKENYDPNKPPLEIYYSMLDLN